MPRFFIGEVREKHLLLMQQRYQRLSGILVKYLSFGNHSWRRKNIV